MLHQIFMKNCYYDYIAEFPAKQLCRVDYQYDYKKKKKKNSPYWISKFVPPKADYM